MPFPWSAFVNDAVANETQNWLGHPFQRIFHIAPQMATFQPPTQQASDYKWTTPEEALSVLRAQPVDVAGNHQLLEELKLLIEWQADLDFMKDPPRGSKYQPYNLLDKLETIQVTLSSNETYSAEHEVQRDIETAFLHARDGHLMYYSDIRRHVGFSRDTKTALVSVADDSRSVPSLFLLKDILQQASLDEHSGTDTNSSISAVTHINNVDAVTYLLEIANDSSNKNDEDGRFDELLARIDEQGQLDPGRFPFPSDFVGANTTIAFANGTERVFDNFGHIRVNRPKDKLWEAAMDEMESTPVPPFAGYFLDTESDVDVAVMRLPTFRLDRWQDFQGSVNDFLRDCHHKKKKKLLLDLRGNEGGVLPTVEDLLQQLFPSTSSPHNAARLSFRNHPAYRQMGEAVSHLLEELASSTFPRINNDTDLGTTFDASLYVNATQFDFGSGKTWKAPHPACLFGQLLSIEQLDDDGVPFTSIKDIIGPARLDGKPRTQPAHDNFDNPAYFGPQSCINYTISGHGDGAARSHLPQSFAAEDMLAIVASDCSSGCAAFVAALSAHGVKVFRVGGLPNQDPIGAIGGTKGGWTLGFAQIVASAALLENVSSPIGWEDSPLGKLANAKTWQRFGAAAVSVANVLSFRDTSDVPLRMVPDQADARLFYTIETLLDDTAFWTDAVKVWKGSKS